MGTSEWVPRMTLIPEPHHKWAGSRNHDKEINDGGAERRGSQDHALRCGGT